MLPLRVPTGNGYNPIADIQSRGRIYHNVEKQIRCALKSKIMSGTISGYMQIISLIAKLPTSYSKVNLVISVKYEAKGLLMQVAIMVCKKHADWLRI